MTSLYIARHGETEWNREGRLQGWTDAALTERGKAQAKSLGKRLKYISPKKAYISPLGRVKMTADIALDDLSIQVQEDERLKEINLGKWEGLKSKEAERRDPELYRKAIEEPHRYDPPWGEDYFELKERVLEAVEAVLSENVGEKVLIVSHGIASKSILSHIEGRPMKDLREPPHLRECSLSHVRFEDGFEKLEEGEIIDFGDTEHLKSLDRGDHR